jgi:hypothetical protein
VKVKIKIILSIFITIIILGSSGCSCKSTSKAGAFLAKEQTHYDDLGISRKPLPSEDGLRSTGREGTYEWWYIDAEFSDHTKIVVVFYTKYLFDIKGPAHPTVTINIDLPNGETITRVESDPEGNLINASKDLCDIKVQDSFIRYKNGNYEVRFKSGDITYDLLMKPKLPMWRPGTGHWYFGEKAEDYFAWFVAVPTADTIATLTIGSDVRKLSGTGYHDHNWGNEEMNKVFNHWYWSRAAFGDYTIIACDLVSEKKFGYTRLPVFMAARNGKILDDNNDTVVITRTDTIRHPVTKKFIDNTMTFVQNSADGTIYRIDLKRKKDIAVINLLDVSNRSAFVIRILKLIGVNPTYIRTTGDAILAVTEKGKAKVLKTNAIWEQMFFGSNKDAVIHVYRR